MPVEYEGLSFERPGHATVRIETADGHVVYVDPWSEVLEKSPADADLVFVTHDDRDHYDPAGIEPVSGDDATVVVYERIDASDLDRDVVPLGFGDERTIGGVTVRAVPAYNRPDGPHVRPSGEPYHPEQTVVGLVLTIDGTRVYYPSDTDALEELRDVVADVVLPPIGGRYTVDRTEAADLVESIGPDLVLPVHYDTAAVDGIDADAEQFREDVASGGTRVVLF